MADDKRVVRTAGVSGTFVLPGLQETDDGPADLVITHEGVEVTRAQWEVIAEAATVNHVIVRLDEDFPVDVTPAPAPIVPVETGTATDSGTDTASGTSRKAR